MFTSKKIVICSIIFVVAAGIWYQCAYQPDDVQQEILSLDEEESVVNSPIPKETAVQEQGDETCQIEDKVLAHEEAEAVNVEEQKETKGCCYLCGSVVKPGVYEFEEGERILALIERAGGFSKNAEQNYLNLARLAIDGEKIYVPSQDEVEEGYLLSEQEDKQSGHEDAEHAAKNKEEQTSHGDKININTADEGSLTTLPGIGEAKAKSILSYREEHGEFGSIEEIKNIEGIKDGVFQKIQDLITVQS